MIHYLCRHCKIELGQLPQSLAGRVIPVITSFECEGIEPLLTYEQDGTFTVHSICEQCEKTLQQAPHYYELEKWLQ